ncbi:hypothetical protein, partial [Candidatus Symbiopectobacterium sp. NZEC135]|uniref:hypothetical protein n=1 Tax=Candidatus Symbiopectobacterium sp. NZEC135 TaxID=2820471 RepID=UPI002226097D
ITLTLIVWVQEISDVIHHVGIIDVKIIIFNNNKLKIGQRENTFPDNVLYRAINPQYDIGNPMIRFPV